jgi:hypothetical protein
LKVAAGGCGGCGESYQYGLARLKRKLEPVNPSSVLHTVIRNIRNLKMDSKMFDQFGSDLVLEKLRSSKRIITVMRIAKCSSIFLAGYYPVKYVVLPAETRLPNSV